MVTFDPSMTYPQMQPQGAYPFQPFSPPQAIPQRPVQGLIRVTGMEGAKAYQMPPNSVMPLFDSDSDTMYVKYTDGAGFPTIRTFAFAPVEHTEQCPQGDYVTRAEFESLKEMIAGAQQPVPVTATVIDSE